MFYYTNQEVIWSGKHYYTKKNQYSINFCAVGNSSKKFIYAITGYSGVTHDAQVWGLTQIYQNSSRYFLSREYLLRDSAYPPTRIIVPPYKGVAKNNPQNKEFNQYLSSIQFDIEHAFGMLKGQWKSLTDLRLLLATQKKYEFACM